MLEVKELKNVDNYNFLDSLEERVNSVLYIRFEGYPWNMDVLEFAEPVWEFGFRDDILKLSWLKRKLDVAKEYKLPISCVYDGKLIERFRLPISITVSWKPLELI